MAAELEVRGAVDYGSLERLAKACAQSGYFKDATDAAKAYVKVCAGVELGIGPVQAMTGIHIVQGKPTLAASLVGALIKRSGRYDYRVTSLDDTACTLTFYEDGKPVGDSTFTTKDAEKAGLTKNPTWKSFPRNMLLSRALTNGARWYCPDVFGGAVYTPDELGAEIDGDGEVISIPASEVSVEIEASAPLTNEQRKQLIEDAKAAGIDEPTLKAAMFSVCGVESTADVRQDELPALYGALEIGGQS